MGNNANCLNLMGLIYQKLKDFSNAQNYFELAMKHKIDYNSHKLICRNFLINTFNTYLTNKYAINNLSQKEQKRLENVFEKYRNDPAFNRELGFIYFYEFGDFDNCIKYYLRGDNISKQWSKLKLNRIYSTNIAMYGERNMFINNLNRLLKQIRKKEIMFSDEEICSPLFLGFNYYLAYQNKDNKILQERINMLYRMVFPQLNYTSPWVENYGKKIKKPKIGFLTTHWGNHSVSRDRFGIISHLDTNKFDIACCWFSLPEDNLANIIWKLPNKKKYFITKKII